MTKRIEKIVLLVGGPEGAPLQAFFKNACADLCVEMVTTLDDLEQALCPTARLVSFGTGLIVPEYILKSLHFPAYNIHPGPPEYPGIFPSVHALYEKATSFGTTVHEMAERVDEGAIVYVSRFSIPPTLDRLGLDLASFEDVLRLMPGLAPRMAKPEGLKPSGDLWSEKKRTLHDFKNLCCLPEKIDADEFALRYRAIGEGPDHALEINLHGHRFVLAAKEQSDVVRAGQPVAMKK